MSPRPDISEKLIHFTGGNNLDEAFENLGCIVESASIQGSNRTIKGGYTCVCFTEAPHAILKSGLVNLSDYSRYHLFGILYDKRYVFDQGGRPVIYQPDSEFELLPEELRWRHMRYEPNADRPIDFTWEREWRVQTPGFAVTPEVAGIVVPDDEWGRKLIEQHEKLQDNRVHEFSQIMERFEAEQYRDRFPWNLYVVNEREGALSG